MPSHERDIYERKAQVIKRRMEEQETQQKARLQEQEKLMQAHHHELVSHVDPQHLAMGAGMTTAISQAQIQMQAAGPTQLNAQPTALATGTPHQTAAMQFYQTTPNAPGTASVIQLMHTTTPSTIASTSTVHMQSRPGIVESLAPGTAVLTNPMSHAPILATTGGQQVCCS